MMKLNPYQKRPNQRGNGALEFAIGFSLLWACFAGVFQYGYSMYVYNGLQSAVVDGATFASRASYCADKTTFVDQIKGIVVYGDPTNATGYKTVPGLTTGNVDVIAEPATFPQTITVRIINFTPLFQSITFINKPTVTVMYLGNYRPKGSGC
jgi:Flp pilus assembly protein TadG